MFEKEKKQYEEDCKNYKRPWELWQWVQIDNDPDCEDWKQLKHAPSWWHKSKYRRKPTTFNIEYYSGLNWRDAEHLVGKIIEYSDFPGQGWKVGKLKKLNKIGENFVVNTKNHCTFYTYIRTISKHPTINIGGVELPMPETVAPANETKYWIFPYPAHRELFRSLHWSYSRSDIDALQAGQVHLTEERAKAWTDWWKKEVLAKIKEIAS